MGTEIKHVGIYELYGYVNAPEMELTLELTEPKGSDPFRLPEVVKTTYWAGQFGRGWQSIDASAVVAIKYIMELDENHPYKSMSLWVVKDYGLLAPADVRLFTFALYDLENTFRPRRPHDGAYAEYVEAENGDVVMNNGWSSRPGIFNATGILPHVMDIRVRMVTSSLFYGGFVTSVAGVEKLLHQHHLDETYQVAENHLVDELRGLSEIRYGLTRKEVK